VLAASLPPDDPFTPEHVRDVLIGWLGTSGLRIVLTLLLSWLVLRMVRAVGARLVRRADDQDPKRVSEEERRAQTLAAILHYATRIVVFAIIGLVVLREVGTDITPFLTGAGILGVALGFGAQSLVKDVLAGVFILTEEHFRVGDVVELAGKSGVVERVNLRTTLVRSMDGAVHIVPNGQITVATNMSFRWSRAVLDLQLGYDTDLEKVEEILRKIGADMKADPQWSKDLLEEPEITGVESFNESSINIRVMVKTLPLRQWDVARQLRRRVKREFDKAGVQMPFPQRVIHYKATGAPPAGAPPAA
jgi:moderate conductance mechanosensitive channel